MGTPTLRALGLAAALAATASCGGNATPSAPSSRSWSFGTVSQDPEPGSTGEETELDALYEEADPPVPLDRVLVDPEPLLPQVQVDRMMRDVSAVAAAPRSVEDPAPTVLAAANRARSALADAGLQVHEIPVAREGHTYPAVWASVKGTSCSNRAVLVVGHYDSVPGAPGADDNASGYAATLEPARVLAKHPLPVTVVLGAVPFEELGTPYAGAKSLLTDVQDAGMDPVLGISLDMLAYPSTATTKHPQGVLLQLGYANAVPAMTVIRAASVRWGDGHRIRGGLKEGNAGSVGRSDHAAFHAAGIPALFVTDGGEMNPNYHEPSDTPDTLDREYYQASARMVLAGIVAYASLDADGDRTADACRAG